MLGCLVVLTEVIQYFIQESLQPLPGDPNLILILTTYLTITLKPHYT